MEPEQQAAAFEQELTPAMLAAGMRALQLWYEGDGFFEEGVRQIWIETRSVQEREKICQC